MPMLNMDSLLFFRLMFSRAVESEIGFIVHLLYDKLLLKWRASFNFSKTCFLYFLFRSLDKFHFTWFHFTSLFVWKCTILFFSFICSLYSNYSKLFLFYFKNLNKISLKLTNNGTFAVERLSPDIHKIRPTHCYSSVAFRAASNVQLLDGRGCLSNTKSKLLSTWPLLFIISAHVRRTHHTHFVIIIYTNIILAPTWS